MSLLALTIWGWRITGEDSLLIYSVALFAVALVAGLIDASQDWRDGGPLDTRKWPRKV